MDTTLRTAQFADRRLSCYMVPEDLSRMGIDYIMPLNLKAIDYFIKLDRSSVYIDWGMILANKNELWNPPRM